MKNYYRFILPLFLIVFASCKNETNANSQHKENTISAPIKKELSPEKKKIVKSVFMRAMQTEDIKTFVSALISTKLSDTLTNSMGPYTIFAPSNKAFSSLTGEENSLIRKTSELQRLKKSLQNHIILDMMDSVALVQEAKKNNGLVEMNTLGASKIKIIREGMELFVMDSEGKKAKLVKTDVLADNGILHVIDTVLWTK